MMLWLDRMIHQFFVLLNADGILEWNEWMNEWTGAIGTPGKSQRVFKF